MKKIAIAVLFCLLFPTTFTLAANAADASIDAEVAVFHALQETGWEDNYVALQDDGQLLIRYDAVVISSDLIDHMLGIAVTAYETVKTYTPDQAVQEIAVEAYFNDEAICSATVAYADLQAYASGSINESALVDRTAFQDIRSLDTLLKYDLALFSVIVNDIEIGKDTAKILLEFAGDSEETFWKDYSAMVLVVVEDCPWVKTVEMSYISDDSTTLLTLSAATEDILALVAETITPDEFINRVAVAETDYTGTAAAQAGSQTEDAAEDGGSGGGLIVVVVVVVVIAGAVVLLLKKKAKKK